MVADAISAACPQALQITTTQVPGRRFSTRAAYRGTSLFPVCSMTGRYRSGARSQCRWATRHSEALPPNGRYRSLTEVPICRVCGRPASVADERSGEPAYYCLEHVPTQEAREFGGQLQELGWTPPN